MTVRHFACTLGLLVIAQPVFAAPPGTPLASPPRPEIGAAPVAVADLLVPRVPTRSCTVTLFARREFEGEARQPIAFAPPADCPGPWAKVVFEGEFAVSAGEQFDRTGIVNLAGINLFTGTTMEPRRVLAPEWHVERDVTDYSALFRTDRTGEALLTNFVDARYTGRIKWNARLVFYTADAAYPAPAVADLVAPLSDTLTALDAKNPSLTRQLTLPRNMERLMLDVLAVPQGDDEFWYSCTPDRFAGPVDKASEPPCGAPFRETEVGIDGRLAGIAPIYPWIYTGGMNPALWTIIPGIDTLDLRPYRVDLTPFAGLLNDGTPHALSLTVAGVRRYMFAMGTLMAWRDAGRSIVPGAITRNTLAPAALRITGAMQGRDETAKGHSRTATRRVMNVAGYVDTAHGRVETRIAQTIMFSNRQKASGNNGTIDQTTDIDTRTTRSDRAGLRRHRLTERYPLHLTFTSERKGEQIGSGITARQSLLRDERTTDRTDPHRRTTHAMIDATATTTMTGKDITTRQRQGSSLSRVVVRDDRAGCYDRTITVHQQRVASVVDGCADRPRR